MPLPAMRLRKLVVHGFKSFADRTEFVFDSPVTGIVGPNGCGKSNVVDAFKWVLGEQSAKSLRGDAMMDVLFNGAATRKPAGMAEVVLVFENPKGLDDGPRPLAVDADEVAVGRRLYRDGASEYHLNGKASRLRDVRDLFMDTGVGVDAYSVIEQGRVSALLEANPAERRLIFEEAAGVSKFKAQRKEARRKLDRVDQNLLRVHDVVAEVEKQLRGVKIQAGKARVYQEHAARLAQLRLQLALHEYHVQHNRTQELAKAVDEATFRVDDLAGDATHKGAELTAAREKADAVAQHRQRAEYEQVQTGAALQSAQQKQHYAAQQLRQMAEQVQTFDRDRTALEAKRTAAVEALAAESDRLATLTADLAKHRADIEQKQGGVQGRPASVERAQPRGRAAQVGRAGPDAAAVAGKQPPGRDRDRTPQPLFATAAAGRPAAGRRRRDGSGDGAADGTASEGGRGGGRHRRPTGGVGGDQAGRGRAGQAAGRRQPAVGVGPRGPQWAAIPAEGAQGFGNPPRGRQRGREVGPAAAGAAVPRSSAASWPTCCGWTSNTHG